MSDMTPLEAALARRLGDTPELAAALYKIFVEVMEECRGDFSKALYDRYEPRTAEQYGYGAERHFEYLVGRFPRRHIHVDLDGASSSPEDEDLHV